MYKKNNKENEFNQSKMSVLSPKFHVVVLRQVVNYFKILSGHFLKIKQLFSSNQVRRTAFHYSSQANY